MAKYDFTASTNQLVKTASTSGGAATATARIDTFMRPTFNLAADKIVIKDSGVYQCSLMFSEFGTIATVAPTSIGDAITKLIALVATMTV